MPRRSSGTRNVARSLATAMSASMAIRRPPAWQIPLTAATTGARLSRMVRKGRMSWPMSGVGSPPGGPGPPAAPPRGEDVPGAGDDERGQVRVLVDDADGPLDAEVHRRREGVPGCGPVDHAPGHGALPLEAQTCGAEFL